MKPTIIAQIVTSLPAKADEMVASIWNRVGSKPLWQGQENRVARGLSDNSNPAVDVELRFDKLADRDDLVKYLKSLDDRPNVKVIGKIHDCGHDNGQPCVNWKGI